jgi:hypothetical protein
MAWRSQPEPSGRRLRCLWLCLLAIPAVLPSCVVKVYPDDDKCGGNAAEVQVENSTYCDKLCGDTMSMYASPVERPPPPPPPRLLLPD